MARFWGKDKVLTAQQRSIVEKNAKLLLDRDAWSAHVDAFEEQLALIKGEDERSKTRARFEIRFDRYSFLGHKANFTGLHFPCSISFREAIFGDGIISFNGATFSGGGVSFDGATFGNGVVLFSRAIFGSEKISFIRATFGDGNVLFDNIKLGETTIFFDDIDVGGNLFVRDTTFRKWAISQRASVKGTADFSDNIFHEVPDFRDTIFARPPEVAGMEVPPPQMEVNKALKIAKNIPAFNIAKYKEDVAKYRQLKKMALAANDHEKDIEFFAYEMLAKRGCEKGSMEWYELLANWFYFKLSNFGQNYWHLAIRLFVSLILFGGLYAVLIFKFLTRYETFCFALLHSFKNFLPFLSSLFRYAPRREGYPSGYDKIFINSP